MNFINKRRSALSLRAAAALLLGLLSGWGIAQEAYTRSEIDLHAGPSAEYPWVARLAPGQPLNVLGCTHGYGWCDVTLPDGLRGWVRADWLDYAYEGRALPLVSYGATIGVPIVVFTLPNYWGHLYRDRPWYREPRWWGHQVPPPVPYGWRPPSPPASNWRPQPGAGWTVRPEYPAAPPGWNARPDRFGNPEWRQPGWQRPHQPWMNRQPPAAPAPSPTQTIPIPRRAERDH